MKECWKIIPLEFLNGKYEVSDLGNVRHINNRRNPIKPNDNGYGYFTFKAICNGKRKSVYIHRCVLIAFLPIDGMEKLQGNHKNFDRHDNRLINLEWITRKRNMNYSRVNGRFINANKHQSKLLKQRASEGINPLMNYNINVRGEDRKHTKLTNEQVIKIFRSKKKQTELSIEFNIHRTTVRNIKSGKIWGWLTKKIAD